MKFYEGWSSEVEPRLTPFDQPPKRGLQFFTIRDGVSYLLDPGSGGDLWKECASKIGMGYAQLFVYEQIAAFERTDEGVIGWPDAKLKIPKLGTYKQPREGHPARAEIDRLKWEGNLYFAFREPPKKDRPKWGEIATGWLIGYTEEKLEALSWGYRFAQRSPRRSVVAKLIGDWQWH